jgi:hypothetical protein
MGDYATDGSGHQNDYSRYHAPGRHNAANQTWGYSSAEHGGYRVDTDQLNAIAQAMEHDLKDLQTALQKVTSKEPVTTQHLGRSRAGQAFAEMANTAMTGFSQYYNELQIGYRTVISNLYRTAGNYKKAEEYSTSSVASADGGSTSPGQTPTTSSTGSFD